MAYINLAGTYSTLVDGNLRQILANTAPVTLVIGTASKGRTGELYAVENSSLLISEYGRESEVTRGALEAMSGGARNVVVYRLPGAATSVTGIGANTDAGNTDNLFVVKTVQASPEAMADLAFAYEHAVTVVDEEDEKVEETVVVQRLIIVNKKTQETVYLYEAANGVVIDTGVVEVTVPDEALSRGALGNGEALVYTVAGPAAADGVVSVNLDGMAALEVNVTNGDTAGDVAIAIAAAINNSPAYGAVYDAAVAGAVVTVTIAGDAENVREDGVVLHASDHPVPSKRNAPARLLGTGSTQVAGLSIALTAPNNAVAQNIGKFPNNIELPYALGSGTGVFIDLVTTDLATFYASSLGLGKSTSAEAFLTDSPVTLGDTGTSLCLTRRYEKLDEAYSLLDFRIFDIVLPQGVAFNSKNVADDKGMDETQSEYPAANSVNDYLGYLAKVYDKVTMEYVYHWTFDSNPAAPANGFSSNGSFDDSLEFKEVNFAHQLALFCHDSSENYRFCHGVIGATLPTGMSPKAVRLYYGELPTYTWDSGLKTYVVASSPDNGSGLLGHKLVGGRYGFNFGKKAGGIPLTTDRNFIPVSSADIVMDENNAVVDLGKYVSLVGAFGFTRNASSPVTSGYRTGAANLYGGLISSLPVQDSPISARLNSLQIRTFIPGDLADQAAGVRLMLCYVDSEGNTAINEALTAASLDSDYKRLTTMRIIGRIVELIRTAAKPFLGKGLSTSRRVSLDQAFQGVLQSEITGEGTLRGGSFRATQTRAQRIEGLMDVALELEPVFELRRIMLKTTLTPGE